MALPALLGEGLKSLKPAPSMALAEGMALVWPLKPVAPWPQWPHHRARWASLPRRAREDASPASPPRLLLRSPIKVSVQRRC